MVWSWKDENRKFHVPARCALSTVELLAEFLGCTDVVGVHLLLTLSGCSTRILSPVVLEVAKSLVVYKRDRAMQTTLSFLSRWPNRLLLF
jgi:hypothetical protein